MTTPDVSGDGLQSLRHRICRLEAEAEIRRLVSSYHWVNDAGSASGRMPAWGDLTQPASDGTAAEVLRQKQTAGGMAWSGRGLSEAWPKVGDLAVDDGTPRPSFMPRMLHMITNEWIEVGDDEAWGRWYCWEPAVVIVDDEPRAILIAGRITYEFECVDGQWRVTRNEFEEILSTPVASGGWLSSGPVTYGPRNVPDRGSG